MEGMQLIIHERFKTLSQESSGHSVSFKLLLVLMFYMLYFYYKIFFLDNRLLSYYVPILTSFLIFCFLLAKIFLTDNLSGFHSFMFIYLTSTLFIYLNIFSGLVPFVELGVILMSIIIFLRYPIKASEIKILYYLFAISVFLILLNGTSFEDMGTNLGNKFNPNTCAFLLCLLFCVSVVSFRSQKRKNRLKNVNLIFIVMSFCLQFYYGSRTALFGCLLFLFLFLFLSAWKKSFKRRTVLWIIFLASIMGVLVAYIYSEVLYELYGRGKIIIFGKDLFTSREIIWKYTFESIRENFFFGVGSHLNEGLEDIHSMISNAHNQPLALLAAFGVIFFVIFYYTTSCLVSYFYGKKRNEIVYSRSPAVFILVITLMSYFDIYFFSAYNWLPIIIVYGLICSCSKMKKKNLTFYGGMAK